MPRRNRKKTLNARQTLDVVRRTLTGSNNHEALKLWDVLSALRGPDNEDRRQKDCTTAVIRYKLFGSLKPANQGFLVIKKDSSARCNMRKNLNFPPHFYRHAANAFNALGMKWNKVNK